MILATSVLFSLLLVIIQGDAIISENTVGDIVTVNVEVKADIHNEIHQHFNSLTPSVMNVSVGNPMWDRIQEIIGQLPLGPQGSDVPSPDVVKPDNEVPVPDKNENEIVKQLYELLSGTPIVWGKLQQVMKNLPENKAIEMHNKD